MSEIKTSALLTELINAAKEVGNIPDPPFTAERFMVAVIDKVRSCEIADNEELAGLKEIVGEFKCDYDVAKKSLLEYICNSENTTNTDDIYMQNKLCEAGEIASNEKKLEVNSVLLLLCILKSPTVAIASVLEAYSEYDFADEGGLIYTPPITANLFRKSDESDIDEEAKEKLIKDAAKSDISSIVDNIKHIRTELKKSVYGQDNAINTLITGYFHANMLSMLNNNRKRPLATFLFAGPPGVGKTFLAEKMAESLELPFKRFDMSEYADKEANLEFCGSDNVYKNAKAGNVTSFVYQNPKCVLLFDEIEKAHLCVIHLFLQMLDAGRLRDSFTDIEVSFTDAIIIFTTNAGKQLYEESDSGDFSAVSRKIIIKALQKDVHPDTGVPFFPSAICSRFASGNVVMFNQIGAHDLRSIAKKEIERQASSLENKTGIKFEIDERVYTALLFSEGSAADARTIRARAETFFNDELYELFRLIASDKVGTGIGNIDNIRINVDFSHTKANICELFASSDKTKILIFACEDTVAICKDKVPDVDFIGVQDVKTAIETVKSQDIDFVLLDIRCGACTSYYENLNVEDIESPARNFFKFLREQGRGIPVYMLEEIENVLNDEEKISFMRQGVRGFLNIASEEYPFSECLSTIISSLYQQSSMIKLARENKLVTFETAQTISENGKCAEIKLFDFEMSIAVESEDSKNILSSVSKPDIRFDDVIGAREAKKELAYFVEYLKNPKKYLGTGVKAPKGVILYGPPGTGKTMLAKAMACESDVTFIAAEGNQFLKRFVGEGAEKVHELFRTARKYAPSILFIDEIDAIAKERKGGTNSGSNGEETLTAFLTEMDGFSNDPSKPVFVLAATNFDVEPGKDKSLDPALMRRFDRRVYIELPDKKARIRFLKMKISRNHAMDISESQIENICIRATGMSLAEMDSFIELALRSAIREGSTVVNDEILEEAFETFNSGEAKKWDTSQLERVARHEAGHAFLCWLGGEIPSYLTIVARGSHGGYMQRAEREGKAIYTKNELLSLIRTSLGGRAAEIVYYGECEGVSTGASGDLANATDVAQQIVCTYGMDESFGLAVVHNSVAANGAMSVEVRTAVNRILDEQMNEAVRIISENKDKIDALVRYLLLKNHLNSEEIDSILLNNILKISE